MFDEGHPLAAHTDQLWESWALLQWKVYRAATAWRVSFGENSTTDIPPFKPDDNLQKQARAVGAKWLSDLAPSQELEDPLAALAMQYHEEMDSETDMLLSGNQARCDCLTPFAFLLLTVVICITHCAGCGPSPHFPLVWSKCYKVP